MKKNIFTAGFAFFCLSYIAQCGEETGLSKDVILELPTRPVVVNADFVKVIDSETTISIPGPYFTFFGKVTNNSTETLQLATFRMDIRNTLNGRQIESENELQPSAACSDDESNFRTRLAEILAGEKYVGTTDQCTNGDITADINFLERWIIGLPKADTFFYTIDVEALGWFENDEGEPIERLNLTGSIFTQ